MKELSKREKEIVIHLAGGSINKHIARELNISEYTVKTYIQNISTKLNLNDNQGKRMAIVTKSLAYGFIDNPFIPSGMKDLFKLHNNLKKKLDNICLEMDELNEKFIAYKE